MEYIIYDGSMCTHSTDDLLPHAPIHCAATGEMVKGSYNIYNIIVPTEEMAELEFTLFSISTSAWDSREAVLPLQSDHPQQPDQEECYQVVKRV